MKTVLLLVSMLLTSTIALASDQGQVTFLKHKKTHKMTLECENVDCSKMTVRYLYRKNKKSDWVVTEEFKNISQERFESAVMDAMGYYSRYSKLKDAWFYLGDEALGHALFHRSKFLGVMCLISFPFAYALDVVKAPISLAAVLISKSIGKRKIKKIKKNVELMATMQDFEPVHIRRKKIYREVLWSMDGDLYPDPTTK